MSNPRIVALTAHQQAAWCTLLAGYADFYQTPPPHAETVWEWLTAGKLQGAGAENAAGELIGFAHWEYILRPLRGQKLAYLHDLFVQPAARGLGAATQLLEYAVAEAKANGCATLRWATAADNERARRLYRRVATETQWVIYDKELD